MAAYRCCLRIPAGAFQPLALQFLQVGFTVPERYMTDGCNRFLKYAGVGKKGGCKSDPCIRILRVEFGRFCKRTCCLFMLAGTVLGYTEPVPQELF